jgi:hypothetical protein
MTATVDRCGDDAGLVMGLLVSGAPDGRFGLAMLGPEQASKNRARM